MNATRRKKKPRQSQGTTSRPELGVTITVVYERIGSTYAATRKADPRIAALIWQALGDARSVVNVGAGTGSYEPTDREVLAVEPSQLMIAQRPAGSAPALRASAEQLPLADASFDAALAVNTMQHWSDVPAGLAELRRVARRRVVILSRDGRLAAPFWLTSDYFPELDRGAKGVAIAEAIRNQLPNVELVPVPLPSDCQDGLFSAYWARPEAYLDEVVRRNISNFALTSAEALAPGLAKLRADLESGAWDRRYGHLRSQREIDFGLRLFVSQLQD